MTDGLPNTGIKKGKGDCIEKEGYNRSNDAVDDPWMGERDWTPRGQEKKKKTL